jgi:tyrosyl-tRNA synthetase
MSNVYEILKQRGFVEQVTDETAIVDMLKSEITCYAGFDPTATSLHVGHLLPIMALAQMQRAGHRPIVLVGGGTAMIGDPSGKNEMRKILTFEEISENTEKIKEQFSSYIDFTGDNAALLLNNADWLTPVKYIDFLRDIGRHFSVNRMIAAESYRARLETGLNFIEFNYMLLQSYDFLHLFKEHNCVLQIGGNDQWGNIVAGIDLVRRAASGCSYGLTFPLITTASGAKMGKTEKGAVWLDPELTSPYGYYQYWINTDDRDVERFLSYFTFLEMEEIEDLLKDGNEKIQQNKEVLAFEATKITHGEEEAEKAREGAKALFKGDAGALDSVPTTEIEVSMLKEGIPAFIIFEETKLSGTRSEARRLIKDGGGYVNNVRVKSFDEIINESHIKNNMILLRAGKKKYHRILVK